MKRSGGNDQVSSSSGLMPAMSVHGKWIGKHWMLLFSCHASQMGWLVGWLAGLVWFSLQHNGMKIHMSA